MRKLLIPLLLASAAATPALADPPKDREQSREERQQAREERQQSRQEPRQERATSGALQVSRPERVQQPIHVQQKSLGGADRDMQVSRDARKNERGARRDAVQDVRELRAEDRGQMRQERVEARELRQSTRPLPHVMRTRTPVISHVPREGTQPPVRTESRRSPAPQWSTNWRHNNKYDWYNWRKRHRSLFHLGFYYDPFGWGYMPYSIGWRLWPSFYSSRYWIDDAWRYRLPYAPPGYRWVRYWNDAILVDTWNGQVVDVIHNFFW